MARIVIEAKAKRKLIELSEIKRYKDLFWMLAKRDFKVRYAQSYLGILWVFVQPIVNTVFAYLILSVDDNGIDAGMKFILASSAVALWTYFQFVLDQSGGSIIAARNMIQKIYFPRIIVPMSKAILGLIDFSVAILLLVCVIIYVGHSPSLNMLFAPVFILTAIFSSLGFGLIISSLSVKYRDFKYMSPFIVRIGYMLSPIVYSYDSVSIAWPQWLQWLYFLNPMAGAIDGFRWSLTDIGEFQSLYLISLVMSLVILIAGFWYFAKTEHKMADLV